MPSMVSISRTGLFDFIMLYDSDFKTFLNFISLKYLLQFK